MPAAVHENPNLFVVTGGPGSGKTTVLRELAALGFQHAPEVARQIIQEQVDAGGTALPWSDRATYTNLMLQRSIESYLQHTGVSSPMLSDRGIPDTLGYARLIGLRDAAPIESACRQFRYAPLVFIAPPWREIYETDHERKQGFAEAEQTYGLLADVYRECGYELVELPKVPAVLRAKFVKSRIQEVA